MANDTTVTIIGNLTDNPELRVTNNGVSLTRFTVASTPRQYDKASGQWKDGEALFMTCTAWRELAEHMAESLEKGARVIVSGRLKLSRWETPEGEKRSTMQLDVDEVGPSLRFATAKVNKLTRSSNGAAAGTPADDPWATAAPTGNGAGFTDEPPF